jgi:hypothetical protein
MLVIVVMAVMVEMLAVVIKMANIFRVISFCTT